jgi:phosphoribosylanthranilate isomerase
MVQVKICGITNLKDAKAALNYGADALGFVFYQKSKRYITPDNARNIIMQLPPFTITVGIFVNSSVGEIYHTVKKSGINTVQLSGDESPSFVNSLNYPRIKALHLAENFIYNQQELEKFENVIFLLDSAVSYGGSGVPANWQVCREIAAAYPVILAGGLTPHNVTQAIEYVRPAAVDVSSGVEQKPGKKNAKKMREFIQTVKKMKI